MLNRFLKLIIKKDNEWASKLISRLVKEINENPHLLEIEINQCNAPEIYKYLASNQALKLEVFGISLYNNEKKNNVVPLLLQRENDIMLRPLWEEELKLGDKILLACDRHAKNDIEYICQNIYEFYYAITGKEKQTILKGFL